MAHVSTSTPMAVPSLAPHQSRSCFASISSFPHPCTPLMNIHSCSLVAGGILSDLRTLARNTRTDIVGRTRTVTSAGRGGGAFEPDVASSRTNTARLMMLSPSFVVAGPSRASSGRPCSIEVLAGACPTHAALTCAQTRPARMVFHSRLFCSISPLVYNRQIKQFAILTVLRRDHAAIQ